VRIGDRFLEATNLQTQISLSKTKREEGEKRERRGRRRETGRRRERGRREIEMGNRLARVETLRNNNEHIHRGREKEKSHLRAHVGAVHNGVTSKRSRAFKFEKVDRAKKTNKKKREQRCMCL